MSKKKIEKYKDLGNRLYYIIRILNSTVRWKKIVHESIKGDDANIYAFWHQKIFFPTVNLHHVKKKTTLVSPSRDGEMLQSILNKFGYEVIRGSSRDNSVKSLVVMIKALKEGFSLGFACDGPLGPIFEVKPGIIYMAQKTGAKIIPVGGAFKWKYQFEKAWDKFQLPLPFTKGIFYLGEPIEIPKDGNVDDFLKVIDDAINNANKKAEELL